MYDQMFNDIDRHIVVIWQSAGVLAGAFAIFGLVEKKIIPIDVATSLIVLIAAWLLAHVYDASYWYNRNLVIIANIERQFLRRDDLHEIHYYFGKHRAAMAMLTHLRIQWCLGIAITLLVLSYHFVTRIAPAVTWKPLFVLPPLVGWPPLHPWPPPYAEMQRGLPYLTLLACVVFLAWLRSKRLRSYQEFLRNSPGKNIDVTGIEYGVGHPPAPGN
jgi:hypothetical protein